MEEQIKDEKILKIIRDRLVIREDQKKNKGEVFTSPELVCEMLNTLPRDVWTNPKLKWLDPANGIGNFPVFAYYKLMNGLKNEIEDKDERSKHIIENILYMIEIDTINVNVSRKIFKMIDANAKPNIFKGSFLEDKWKDAFKIDKFDVIMGNPPYNNSNHIIFIKNSFKFLKKYLLFITPLTWLSPSSKSYKIIIKKNIILINNDSNYLKNKYFKNIGSTFSYFLIENIEDENDNDTIFIYYKNNIINKFNYNFKKIIYPPSIITPITLSINAKILNKENNNLFIRKDKNDYKNKSDGTYTYPHITFIKNNKPDIKYRNKKDIDQTKYKILLFRNGYLNPYFDEGLNGVGDNIHYKIINSKKKGNLFVKFFNSKLIKFIFKINKYSGYNHGLLMNMIDLSIIDNYKTFTEEDIYKYYGISKEEIELIDSVIKV